VQPTPTLLETLKDLLTAANPGLATKPDLERLERQLDELGELVDAIEERLAKEPK
jgi:hypothetical protein